MTTDPFTILKNSCTTACHTRHACAEGYRQMLASENVSQMMATWRDNWDDLVNSKFSDILATELPKQYPSLRHEMNLAGIYLNECPHDAKPFVRVLIAISDTDSPIHIYGDAQAYLLTDAAVIAHDHAQVYNYHSHATVTLLDYSYAHLLPTDSFAKTHFAKVNYNE